MLNIYAKKYRQKGLALPEGALGIAIFFLFTFVMVDFANYLMFVNTIKSGLSKAASVAAVIPGLDDNNWSRHRTALLEIRRIGYQEMTGLFVHEEGSTNGSTLVKPAYREDKALWNPVSSADLAQMESLYAPIEVILPPLSVSETTTFKSSWGGGVLRKKMRVLPITVRVTALYKPLLVRWMSFGSENGIPRTFHASVFREVVNTETEPALVGCAGEEVLMGVTQSDKIFQTSCPCSTLDSSQNPEEWVLDSQGVCRCREGFKFVDSPESNPDDCLCEGGKYVDPITKNCYTCPVCATAEKYTNEFGNCACCPPNQKADTSQMPPVCFCNITAASCGDNMYFDADKCACVVCPDGLFKLATDTTMCTGCYPPPTWTGAVPAEYAENWVGCGCDIAEKFLECNTDADIPFDINFSTCSCDKCPAGLNLVMYNAATKDYYCACDPTKLNCLSGEFTDAINCKCGTCDPAMFQTVNPYKNGCECDVGGLKGSCQPGEHANKVKCKCEPCLPPFDVMADLSGCFCDVTKVIDTCAAGEYVDSTSCGCTSCFPPYVVKAGYDGCECSEALLGCSADQYADLEQCKCISCVEQWMVNPVTHNGCVCNVSKLTCKAGEHVSTKQCKCISCPEVNQYFDAADDVCKCDNAKLAAFCAPSNQLIDSTTCTCGATCPAGTVVSADGKYCSCIPSGTGGWSCPADMTTSKVGGGCACVDCYGEGQGTSGLHDTNTSDSNGSQYYPNNYCTCPLTSEQCVAKEGSLTAMANPYNCTCVDPCKNLICTAPATAQPNATFTGCSCKGE